METKDREIARILSGKGVSWNDLSKTKKELAKNVYVLTSAKIDEMGTLFQRIEQLKFSKSSLADELGINRKTLGSNNPEISAFIDVFIQKQKTLFHRTSSTRTKEESGDEIEKIIAENEKLKRRDCELVEKENEIRKLTKEIEARKKQYEQLEERYNELKETVAKLIQPPSSEKNGKNLN